MNIFKRLNLGLIFIYKPLFIILFIFICGARKINLFFFSITLIYIFFFYLKLYKYFEYIHIYKLRTFFAFTGGLVNKDISAKVCELIYKIKKKNKKKTQIKILLKNVSMNVVSIVNYTFYNILIYYILTFN